MRFRNGTQEDPKYTTQTTWRLIEIQQWNSGNPNIGLQHFMQMKQRVHKHSVVKRWPGYTHSWSQFCSHTSCMMTLLGGQHADAITW